MQIYIYQSDQPTASAHVCGTTTWIKIQAGTADVNIFLPERSTDGPALAEAFNKALKDD